MSWTPEIYAYALERWMHGESAGQIAPRLLARFGFAISRDGVIGKLKRSGAPKRLQDQQAIMRGARRREHLPAQGKAPRTPRAQFSAVTNAYSFASPPGSKTLPVPPAADPVIPLNIPFTETGRDQCRAVTDTTPYAQLCCGRPATGVYCDAHRALHYVPAPVKKRRDDQTRNEARAAR